MAATSVSGVIPLTGAPQHYPWGSTTAIPAALGLPADGRPWAELWWGTHPGGITLAATDAGTVPLAEVAGQLPYLVKLLAAEQPLSLQAHPSPAQAAAGFAREELLGIPREAPERVYRDPEGKPEIIVALTDFDALCGFRPVSEAAQDCDRAGASELADHLRLQGPAATVAWLLTQHPEVTGDHVLVRRLHDAYPGDPGAWVAVLLNRVRLEPGQALFLPAGVLHMYLHGVGLEVMGASDNVMRGGLTTKHIDVGQLLHVLDRHPRPPEVLRPDGDGWYPTATPAFRLQALGPARHWVAEGPEIVVRVDGAGGTCGYFVPGGSRVEWHHGLGCRITVGPAGPEAAGHR
jgi:mannose-6-phosphate isomerase